MNFLARSLLLVFVVGTNAALASYINSINRGKFVDIFPELPLEVIDVDDVLCRQQSRLYVEALKNLTLWAYESKYIEK